MATGVKSDRGKRSREGLGKKIAGRGRKKRRAPAGATSLPDGGSEKMELFDSLSIIEGAQLFLCF
jgi:hypothetical protein